MRETLGRLLLAVAILLATAVYALVNRYEIVAVTSAAYKLDRWTGRLWLVGVDKQIPVQPSP